MEKRKNEMNTWMNENQSMVLIGIVALVLFASTGIIGFLIDLAFGLVFGIFGAIIGVIGAIIGVVFGTVGAIIGVTGAAFGIFFGTMAIWLPILLVVAVVRASSQRDGSKQKRSIID